MLSANDAIRLKEEKQRKEDAEDRQLTFSLRSIELKVKEAIEKKENRVSVILMLQLNSHIEKVVRNLEKLGYKVDGHLNKDNDRVLDISW